MKIAVRLLSSLAMVAMLFVLPHSVSADNAAKSNYIQSYAGHQLWRRILELADIDVEHVTVVHAQAQNDFIAGKHVLFCCSKPEWHSTPEQEAVQLFTLPILPATEHIIIHRDRADALTTITDLSVITLARVKGFNYDRISEFGETQEYESVRAALQAIVAGEVDGTILMNQEFYANQLKERRPLVVGPLLSSGMMVGRVHVSRPDLLTKINATIMRLQRENKLELMVGAVLRGHDLSSFQ